MTKCAIVNNLKTSCMRTPLSSPFTLFFKVILPCAWLGLGVFALTRAFLEPSELEFIGPVLLLCVWLGVSIVVFYWNNFPVKRVFLDDQFLQVSNYIKQISIPLELIESVRASGGGSWWGLPPYRVIVTLKATSEFGNEIKFIPGSYYKDVVRLLEEKLKAR